MWERANRFAKRIFGLVYDKEKMRPDRILSEVVVHTIAGLAVVGILGLVALLASWLLGACDSEEAET